MTSPSMKYFAFEHLPPHLQEVSAPLGRLAADLDAAPVGAVVAQAVVAYGPRAAYEQANGE